MHANLKDHKLSELLARLDALQQTTGDSETPDEQVIAFLTELIHHDNPELRAMCHQQFLVLGAAALPALESCLINGHKDERIMAANLMGRIGHPQGGGLLCRLLYRRSLPEANLHSAIYEALGRISTDRSLVALIDGLRQRDDLLLMDVISGLEQLADERLAAPLLTCLREDEIQARLLIQTMIDARAAKLMGLVYRDAEQGDNLVELLLDSNDPEAVAAFKESVGTMAGERGAADFRRLASVSRVCRSDAHLLVADDSRALLFFYQGAAKEMGLRVTTVLNGSSALEILNSDARVDVLITDMNMPEMDGIELIRRVREIPEWKKLPIIMATTESEQSQQRLAEEAGVDAFLNKPLNREMLQKAVSKILQSN